MNERVEKPKENKSRAVANYVSQNKSNCEAIFQFVDNRPEAVVQKKLLTQISNFSAKPAQKKENHVGLPDNLKSGVESSEQNMPPLNGGPAQLTRIKGKDTQNDKHKQNIEVILGKANDNALKRYSREIAKDNDANADYFLDLIQTELTERQLASVEQHGQGANWASATAYIDGAVVCTINERANSDDVREGNDFEYVGGDGGNTWGTEIGISSGDTEVSLLDEVNLNLSNKKLRKAKNEIFIRIASTNGACDGCKQRLILLKKKIRTKLKESQSEIPIKISYWYTTTPAPANRQTIPTTYGWNGDAAGMFQYYNHDL